MKNAPLTVTEERRMVLLWLSREEIKPEKITMMQYPREMIKKRAPASPCLNFKSSSIVGIRGDRIIRERKFERKIPTRKNSGPISERKGVETASPFAESLDFFLSRVKFSSILV